MSHAQPEETDVVVVANQQRQGLSQWLWSKPLGQHEAEDDDEDEIVQLAEEAWDEDREAQCKHLYSARTHSKATPPECSSSGRIYQRVQHSLVEFSKPSMNIRSQWSSYSSSQKPLPQIEAPSLMRSTPHATWLPSALLLGNSGSRKMVPQLSGPGRSTDWTGTPRQKTSSTSPTKAMVLRSPRGRS